MAYFLLHPVKFPISLRQPFKLPIYPNQASSAKRPLGCYAISGEGNGAAVNLQKAQGPVIAEIPLGKIRRPLSRTRANDPQKVEDLMGSIAEIGLQEPIDVLEVDGIYYGFSGCHRFEAHQRLGLPTIRCRIRRGTKETLRSIPDFWNVFLETWMEKTKFMVDSLSIQDFREWNDMRNTDEEASYALKSIEKARGSIDVSHNAFKKICWEDEHKYSLFQNSPIV